MLIRRAPRFTASEITDPKLYLSRRELISGAVAALVMAPSPGQWLRRPRSRRCPRPGTAR